MGGFEGWYLFSISPALFGLILAPALQHIPRRLATAALAYAVLWDLLIHEGALFRDYAGQTAPMIGSALFRWSGGGVLSVQRLMQASATPVASWVFLGIRALEVALVALAIILTLGHAAGDFSEVRCAGSDADADHRTPGSRSRINGGE